MAHSPLSWQSTVWVPTISSDRFWIWGPAHLEVYSPRVYNLRVCNLGVSESTVSSHQFWSWGPTNIGIYNLKSTVWGSRIHMSTPASDKFQSEGTTHEGVYNLRIYNLEQPVLDLRTLSPGLQSRVYRLGVCSLGI